MEQQSEQGPHIHGGPSSADNSTARNGPDMPSRVSADTQRTNLLAKDLGVSLEIGFKLLENRVCSLEERLPLIEQSTTFLQSMLSSNVLKNQSNIFSTNSKTPAFDTNLGSSDSETLTGSGSQGGLSEPTKITYLEKQLRTLPPDYNLRISLEASSNAAHSATLSKDMNAPSNPASSESGMTTLNGSLPNGGTPCLSGEFDSTDYLFAAHSTTLENSLEPIALPAYDSGQFPNALCPVHGDMCKTSEICRDITGFPGPEVHREEIIGGDSDVPISDGENLEGYPDPFFFTNLECDLQNFQVLQG